MFWPISEANKIQLIHLWEGLIRVTLVQYLEHRRHLIKDRLSLPISSLHKLQISWVQRKNTRNGKKQDSSSPGTTFKYFLIKQFVTL